MYLHSAFCSSVFLRSFVLSILIAPLGSAFALPYYLFQQISLQEGLSQATVTSVLKDYKGIVWIGTQMGLNRFDQYDLKNYLHDSRKTGSLPDNGICMLQEDSLLNLWIGTSAGLALYNRGGDYFSLQTEKGFPIRAEASCPIKGGILFAGAGLWKYSYADKQFRRLPIVNQINDNLTYIAHWKDNLYLIGTTWKGCYLYNLETCQLQRFDLCPQAHITAYFIDQNRNIWLSPYGKGVLCFNAKGEKQAHYSTQNSGLSNDIVLDILFHQGELWMATDGGGISRLDLQNKQFKTIENQGGNVNSFPVNSVMCLYRDRTSNLWAGTIRGGLLNIREVYMRTFQDVPSGNIYGLTNKTVLSLLEDRGYIYIGTDGGGINQFNPSTNSFKHYSLGRREKVVSITGYSERELLISCFGKGLYFFDKQSGATRPCSFLGTTILNKVIDTGICINVHKIASDKYHILADSVYIYDQSLGRLFSTTLEGIEPHLYTPMNALRIIFSTDSLTYLAGVKNIFRLNNHTRQLSSIYNAPEGIVLNDVCQGGEGHFWMATTRGLMEYNSLNRSVRKIETHLFDEASVVSYDPVGRLWVGARGMLLAYTIPEACFTIFGASDGALRNEYLPTSNLVTSEGNVYLGGVLGLLRIDKNYSLKNRGEPKMELMDLQLNGVTITNQLSEQGRLSIPVHFSSFTVLFVGNEEDVFRRKLYRFYISGLSQEIETEAPVLTLYSLPPGTYEISVSCSNRDGSWTTPARALTLFVPVPWWQSVYFIVFVLLLVASLTYYGLTYYNRKKELALEWQMKEHKELVNEEKVRFLINISHELCTPLMLVYAPLKRLLSNNHLSDKERVESIENACKHVKRMKNLIEMVIDVRRMEMGQGVLRYSTRLLHPWLKEVVGSFMNEYKSREMSFVYDFDDSIEELTFDADKCEIALSNLLMNTLRFAPRGSSVRLITLRISDHVRISLSDQGVGLSEKDLSHLFTRFYQGEHSKEGSGIGLSCAKTLIELQGGRINAYNNEPESGATFYLELPLQPSADVEIPSPSISFNNVFRFADRSEQHSFEDESMFDTSSYSVLIVEDNAELSNFLRGELRRYFNKVYTCNNGRDAFIQVGQRMPDVVISDMMMEQGDGLDLCRQLKEQEKTAFIPIVLLTARADVESTVSGYRSGADVYLSKPFDMDDLLSILRNLLKNRKQLQTLYRNSQSEQTILSGRLSNADDLFVRKLNQVVWTNLSESHLDSDFLSEQMGMSRTSLYNRMRIVLHSSVSDYINALRIQKALQMLRETNCSILEISELIGFRNQGYFSTFFKKIVGSTPSKYREDSLRSGNNESRKNEKFSRS